MVTHEVRKILQFKMKRFIVKQAWSHPIFCSVWLKYCFEEKAKPNPDFNNVLTVFTKSFNSDIARDLAILCARLGYSSPAAEKQLDYLSHTMMYVCGERGPDLSKVFHDQMDSHKQLYLKILCCSQK
jgi:hypothetical protein